MTAVVLFHHTQGLTDGVRAFADDLRAAGHTVTVPDLFEGRTFPTVRAGMEHAEEVVGMDEVIARGVAAAAGLPTDVVYAGFSMGVLPAQKLAQTRPGARGALLLFSAVPASAFGAWPDGVALQMHFAADDPWSNEEDLPAARELARTVAGAELFVYPGSGHLICDDSLDDYDEAATQLILERAIGFLGRRP